MFEYDYCDKYLPINLACNRSARHVEICGPRLLNILNYLPEAEKT